MEENKDENKSTENSEAGAIPDVNPESEVKTVKRIVIEDDNGKIRVETTEVNKIGEIVDMVERCKVFVALQLSGVITCCDIEKSDNESGIVKITIEKSNKGLREELKITIENSKGIELGLLEIAKMVVWNKNLQVQAKREMERMQQQQINQSNANKIMTKNFIATKH